MAQSAGSVAPSVAQGLDEDERTDALAAEDITSVAGAQELVSRLIAVGEAQYE